MNKKLTGPKRIIDIYSVTDIKKLTQKEFLFLTNLLKVNPLNRSLTNITYFIFGLTFLYFIVSKVKEKYDIEIIVKKKNKKN